MKRAIGIDFGGTRVKLGCVTQEGRVEKDAAFDTAEASHPNDWIDAIEQHLREWGLDQESLSRTVAGIGAGVPGFVDYSRGFIHRLTNVDGWEAVPLARLLTERFGVPAFVDNDVNAMALGESTYGAGRPYRHAVFLTLGTGVGGALWLDGRLYRGAYSMAGEIGHMSIDRNGPESVNGRGGLEMYIGRVPFVERARKGLARGPATRVRDHVAPDGTGLTPRILARAACEGDAWALELFDDFSDALATTLASITYLLQPEVFIVGGGIAQAGPVLFEPLGRHLRERLNPHFSETIHVCPAALGPAAGTIGAATLAFSSQ